MLKQEEQHQRELVLEREHYKLQNGREATPCTGYDEDAMSSDELSCNAHFSAYAHTIVPQ